MVRIWSHVLVLCFVFSASYVNPQNSIKPRKRTAVGSDAARKGVGQCPNIGSLMDSPCTMPCSEKEDCENHGHALLCCKTLPGRSCEAECMSPVFVPNQTDNGCINEGNGLTYKVGQTFLKSGKCCTCKEGGKTNCSDAKEDRCHKGCTFNFRHYRHSEVLPTRACRNCSCSNGSVVCKAGARCPKEKCQYNKKYYKEGDILQLRNGCKSCVCQANGWKCVAVSCEAAGMMRDPCVPQIPKLPWAKANSKGCRATQYGAYFQVFLHGCLFLRGIL